MFRDFFDITDELFRVSYDMVPVTVYKGSTKVSHTQKHIKMPKIKDVVFNDPATVVFWDDGTKTVVKCQKNKGDTYSKETGLAMAIAKKVYGNNGAYNDIFNRWVRE